MDVIFVARAGTALATARNITLRRPVSLAQGNGYTRIARPQRRYNTSQTTATSSSSTTTSTSSARTATSVPIAATIPPTPTTAAGGSVAAAAGTTTITASKPIWQRLGPISYGFAAFGRSQKKRPYVTQFCGSLFIYLLGDLSAQNIGGDEYDPRRTGRALIISALSSIPSYKWFMFLTTHFNYASRALSIATKVTVNQIVFAPVFNTYFFGMQSLLAGDPLPRVWDRIRRTVPPSMLNSLKLWPAVTTFSFTFIDPQYRSIFAGCIAIGWQTYLSYLNRSAEVLEKRDDELRAVALVEGASL